MLKFIDARFKFTLFVTLKKNFLFFQKRLNPSSLTPV